MTWFWPFRKTTSGDLPVLVEPVNPASTPKAVATPKPVVPEPPDAPDAPAVLERSCLYKACGSTHVCCVPVALSCCLPCRPLWPLKEAQLTAPDSLSTPPLEIRSVDLSQPVDALVTALVQESVPEITHVTVIPTQASS